MPAGRTRPALALLVSLLVHLAAALAMCSQASYRAGGPATGAGGGAVQALTVRLVAAPVPEVVAPGAVLAAGAPAAARRRDAARAPEPRYFDARAMTQEPEVAEGLVAGRLLIVPGIAPQTVALQVWLSGEGTVERVVVETPVPEEDMRKLLAAFADVKFHPGRIGRSAVRSHLALEIMLEDAVRL